MNLDRVSPKDHYRVLSPSLPSHPPVRLLILKVQGENTEVPDDDDDVSLILFSCK